MSSFKFGLGKKVKCTITGFTGVIISRTQWLTNCNTYGVKSQTLKDGKPMESVWFDEPTLQIVDEVPVMKESRSTGGPTESISLTNR